VFVVIMKFDFDFDSIDAKLNVIVLWIFVQVVAQQLNFIDRSDAPVRSHDQDFDFIMSDDNGKSYIKCTFSSAVIKLILNELIPMKVELNVKWVLFGYIVKVSWTINLRLKINCRGKNSKLYLQVSWTINLRLKINCRGKNSKCKINYIINSASCKSWTEFTSG